MPKIKVECDECDDVVEKYPSEMGRRGGGNYCSLSCVAVASNRPRKAKEIVVICPCGNRLKTTTHNKAKKHCNRSCATIYSRSEATRKAQREAGLAHAKNLITTAETLKRREAWKYVLLEKHLEGRDYETEYSLRGRVFDLALLDTRVLVEFDGPEHLSGKTARDDEEKDQIAAEEGFLVVRRPVIANTVIDPETIEDL